MSESEFKILVSHDVPPGLASLVASQIIEEGTLFNLPVAVSKRVPAGEVWIFAPLDEEDSPCARLSNLSAVQDSLTADVQFKHPLKTIGLVLSRDKEDSDVE